VCQAPPCANRFLFERILGSALKFQKKSHFQIMSPNDDCRISRGPESRYNIPGSKMLELRAIDISIFGRLVDIEIHLYGAFENT
jgi:hypothetical protein